MRWKALALFFCAAACLTDASATPPAYARQNMANMAIRLKEEKWAKERVPAATPLSEANATLSQAGYRYVSDPRTGAGHWEKVFPLEERGQTVTVVISLAPDKAGRISGVNVSSTLRLGRAWWPPHRWFH
jgi:hypothetical protein